MANSMVSLSVPAVASYARSVRMLAANLAVLCGMNVDEVEDARMAAEEAFVYACATEPVTCDISFEVSEQELLMSFSLGDQDPEDDDAEDGQGEPLGFALLLLEAVSDSCEVSADGTSLLVSKLVGGTYAE
ncbi:MAG: ATP-binding protein [Coriobacteriales bacterium]|nr:ATP-binding protein [Coriobacteriales bacterium]